MWRWITGCAWLYCVQGTGRSPSDKETVCWLLVKAFVSSLATGPAGANYTVPRILVVPGLTAEDFGIMEGKGCMFVPTTKRHWAHV